MAVSSRTECLVVGERMTGMERFAMVDVDLQLIILVSGLVIVDRFCDAFAPVQATS